MVKLLIPFLPVLIRSRHIVADQIVGVIIEHIQILRALGMLETPLEIPLQVIDEYLLVRSTIDKHLVFFLIQDDPVDKAYSSAPCPFRLIFLTALPVFLSKTKILPSLSRFVTSTNRFPIALTLPWVINSSFVSNGMYSTSKSLEQPIPFPDNRLLHQES